MRTSYSLTLVLCLGLLSACASKPPATAGEGQPGSKSSPAPVKVVATHDGLLPLPAVAKLDDATFKPVDGYPGKGFHLGAFRSADAWNAFQSAAKLPLDDIDFDRHMVVYAVFDAQTNALSFKRFDSADGVGALHIQWDGIEPFYGTATPAVFAVIERGNLSALTFHAQADSNLKDLGRLSL